MGRFGLSKIQSPPSKLVKVLGPYQYEALENQGRQIRLLNLHPSVDTGADISYTLATASLDRLASYEALSYVWEVIGDTCPDPIYIDGHAMTVSTNLEAALRALRYPNMSRTLWIDAICINQSDMDERGNQVTFMGAVYSKAKSVTIWLGTQSDGSSLAMSSLADLRSKESMDRISTR